MIKQISIRNYKNIEEMDLSLVQAVYLIKGENDLGKSHLIEALIMVLTGDRSASILTQGKESGKVEATIEVNGKEYGVSLTYSKANPRGLLRITDIETGMSSDNKSLLQSICQYTDFDAGQFLQWSETADGRRRQIGAVKALLPADLRDEIISIEGELMIATQTRRAANAQVKETQTLIRTYTSKVAGKEVGAIVKAGPYDRVAANDRLDNLYTMRKEVRVAHERMVHNKTLLEDWAVDTAEAVNRYEIRAKAVQVEIDQFIKMLEEKQVQLDTISFDKKAYNDIRGQSKAKLESTLKDQLKWIEENGGDTESLIGAAEHDLETADRVNADYDLCVAYSNLTQRLHKEETVQAKAGGTVSELTKARINLITSADMPIKGLTFDEEQLYLNGLPFNKHTASTSEMLNVACSMQIAANKNTGVFKVMNGESLGADKLRAVIDFARKNKFQGFIEEVQRGQDKLTVELIEVANKAKK